MFKIEYHTKRIFRISPILRNYEMVPFCNLFIELYAYLVQCAWP